MSQTNTDEIVMTKNDEEAVTAEDGEKAISAQDQLNFDSVKLFQEDNYDAAIVLFDKLVSGARDGDEKLTLYLCNRAMVLIMLDRLEEAIADAAKAQSLDDKFPSSYIMQGKAYAYKDKKGQALDILKQGLSKNKESDTIKTEIMKLEGEIQLDNMVPKSDPTRQKINQYIDGLKNQGVEFSKIQVKMLDVKTTVVIASKDIAAGERILFVPDDIILDTKSIADIPANSWLSWNTDVSDKVIFKEQNAFALHYLHEKDNQKSKYKKYFEQLGTEIIHPSLWEKEAIEVLKGSFVQAKIEEQQKKIEHDYEIVRNEIDAGSRDTFTLNEYKFAWALVDKYGSDILRDGQQSVGMIPFVNFFNYNEDTCCDLQYDSEKGGICVVSKRRIMRGQNVSLTAPSISNDWLLTKKGIVSQERPTAIPFKVELSQEDPMYKNKVEAMGGKFSSRTFSLTRNINSQSFLEYIHFIRFYLWAGSQEQLDSMRNTEIQWKKDQNIPHTPDTAFLGYPCNNISNQTEKLVWEMVYKQCTEVAEAHGINLQEAQQFLELCGTSGGKKLTVNENRAWQYMICEKTELGLIYKMSAMMLELLNKDYAACIKHLGSDPYYNQWSEYIKTTILVLKDIEQNQ